MCVTHVYGLAGAAQVGGPQNLVPKGMFTGHPAHVWVVVLRPFVWDASWGPQRYCGEVRLWVNRPPPVWGVGGPPPPKPCLGGNQLPCTNHGAPRGPRRLKMTGIGVALAPAFRPPGPIYL